jgi:hypothetical protein
VPNNRPRYSGRFWYADDRERVVPGHLDLSGKWPRIELLGGLSRFLEEVPSGAPGVSAFGPAPPAGPRTVHGEIMGPNRRVTLLGARSYHHRTHTMNVAAILDGTGLEEETLEGTHAVVGAHLQDHNTQRLIHRRSCRNVGRSRC